MTTLTVALVRDNTLVNLAEFPAASFDPDIWAEFDPQLELIPTSELPAGAAIGWQRSSSGQWAGPTPEPEPGPEPQAHIITRLAFRNRFTAAEKAAIELASLDNPSAPLPERQAAAALRAYIKDVDAATFIDLQDASLISGVNTLEAFGIIEAGRADEILSLEINAGEKP